MMIETIADINRTPVVKTVLQTIMQQDVKVAHIPVAKTKLQTTNDVAVFVYIGEDVLKLSPNGVSATGPQLHHGTLLSKCINQYSSDNNTMRMHAFFKQVDICTPRCCCGACGCTWVQVHGHCSCEPKIIENKVQRCGALVQGSPSLYVRIHTR